MYSNFEKVIARGMTEENTGEVDDGIASSDEED